jgi:hypothetical protein
LRERLKNLKNHPLLKPGKLPEAPSKYPNLPPKSLAQSLYRPNNQRKSYLMSEKLLDLMNENNILERYLHSESFRS